MSLPTLTGSATVNVEQGPESARGAVTTPSRGDIQGMRAVAVLLVMLGHAGLLGLGGGYVGVDVFFVISGFLITGILARAAARTGRVSIVDFYARRARRILPAATVTLLIVAAVSVVGYTEGNAKTALHDIGWAAFFAANLHFASAGTGYFADTDLVSPVQHFWSLAVEEQFYLVWPALIALVFAASRRQSTRVGRAVTPRSYEVWLGRCRVAILVLTVASLAWSVVDTASSPQSAYFSTFTRGWELGVGALLAMSLKVVERVPPWCRAAATWVGVAAIGWAGFRYSDTTPFPGFHAALPVLGAALLLGGGIGSPAGGAAWLLDRRPLRFIGDISYSLYLWHWPLLVLPAAFLGRDLKAYESVIALAVAIGMAWVSYRWVETPLRHGRPGPRGTRRALAMWPASTAAVMAVVLGVGAYAGTTAGAATAAVAPTNATPEHLAALVGAAAQQARAGVELPGVTAPALDALGKDYTEVSDQCWASTIAAVSHDLCFAGDTSSTRTIVAWGDSHMGMWMVPIAELARARHYRVVLLSKSSCLPIDQLISKKNRAYKECVQFDRWALDRIRELKPERVILTGSVGRDLVDPRTGARVALMAGRQVNPEGSRLFRQGIVSTLTKLAALTPDVSVISDVTVLPKSAGVCLGSRTATRATCAVPLNPLIADRNASLRAAAVAAHGHYVDLIPYLCDERTCPLVVGSTIVYRDAAHVTKTYAQTLKPVLKAQLRLG